MGISTNRELTVGLRQRPIITSQDFLDGSGLGAAAAAAWPSANLAFYMPLVIVESVSVKRILVPWMTTAAGNVDVGLYTEAWARIVSTGSTAITGTSRTQVFDIADQQLEPGRYYMAMAIDNNTDTPARTTGGSAFGFNLLYGVKEEAAAFPLPATATPTESTTRAYIPLMAITLET